MSSNNIKELELLDEGKARLIKAVLLIAAFLSVIFFLFRVQFASNFSMLLGDRFDAIIEASILEHWFNFFSGYSSWLEVNYFSPYLSTLGYNDGYFIYGVLFSLFRAFGLDVFLSSELVNVSLKAIGFFSTFYLCRRFLGLAFFSSLLAAVLFSLSNGMVAQSRHAQLLSVCFSPLLACFIFWYVGSIAKRDSAGRTTLAGVAAVLLLNAWLMTAFYMAWFFVFFFFIFSSFAVFYSRLSISELKALFLSIKENPKVIAIPGLIWAITVVPFLYVYLPKARETGMHSFQDVMNYAPTVANVLDPGHGNVIFGALSDLAFSHFFPSVNRSGELQVGFPPLMIITCLTIFFALWKVRRGSRVKSLYLALVSAVFASVLLVVKFGDFTLWKAIWQLFPGAKGMRVTARYLLFLAFPISVLCAFAINELYVRGRILFALLLGLAVVLEQLNVTANAELDRRQQLSFLSSASFPPQFCKSFFVIGQRPEDYKNPIEGAIGDIYPHNVDAMLLAEHFKLRTINGFSTFNPPFWDFRSSPAQNYMGRVRAYAKRFGLENGLCAYDLLFSKWISSPLYPNVAVKDSKPLPGESLELGLASTPILSPDRSVWRVLVSIKNLSPSKVDGYAQGLNLGVRKLDEEGRPSDVNYLRLPLGDIDPYGQDFVVVEIPASADKIAKFDIVPVQEGIGWIFSARNAPVRVNL